MNRRTVITLLIAGWAIGLALKYVVFGLAAWDTALHPERYQADVTGPYRAFAKPFLGIFSQVSNA